MNEISDIERVIVAVKYLGKNSKEIIYGHRRKVENQQILKLQEIKQKLDDSNLIRFICV